MNDANTHTKKLTRIFGPIVVGIVMVLSVWSVSADTNALTPDISSDEFRITHMGPDGDMDYDANNPAMAWNSTDNEYLLVWESDNNIDFGSGELADGEFEIYGQRLDADGNKIGAEFRISDMGPDGDPNYDALNPAVAWNGTTNEYLVVWEGDNNSIDLRLDELKEDRFEVDVQILDPQGRRIDLELDGLEDDEFEIYGQIIDAQGNEIGTNDFRISSMGPDGDRAYGAHNPDVIWIDTGILGLSAYHVVWAGSDNSIYDGVELAAGEFEIFGQKVNVYGIKIGPTGFRISDMGPDGDPNYDALGPALVLNTTDDEYMVVWSGDDDIATGDDEFEIFGQRVDAEFGGKVTGTENFIISDMGVPGEVGYSAFSPAITWNAEENEYLAVWEGKDRIQVTLLAPQLPNIPNIQDGNPELSDQPVIMVHEFEIYGQRMDGLGNQLGINDFRISDMGPMANSTYWPRNPDVVWDSTANEYLVVWSSSDDRDFGNGPLGTFEDEIFGQKIDFLGTEIGDNDFRISSMGLDGDSVNDANKPALAFNAADNNYFVAWHGGDDPVLYAEYEIYGNFIEQASTLKFKQASFTATEGLNVYVEITVERLGRCDNTVTVDFATEDATTDFSDYSSASGTLTFAKGETEKSFEVLLLDDFEDEPDETLTLSLSNAQTDTELVEIDPHVYGQGIAELIILDNDVDGLGSITSSITSGTDDVEEQQDGTMYTDSSDMELVDDGNDNQLVGLIFRNINIPQGASITNAFIQFTTDEVSAGICDLEIFGEDTDNPADFTNNAFDLSSSRYLTTEWVRWLPTDWNTIGEAGEDQKTPNINTIIQEIVDRAGWVSNNSVNILISGSGRRTAEAYESGANTAAKLVVEYTTN